jgi:hypothetical protein
MGRLHLDAELAKLPIAPNVYTMINVVWYFVGGCMALFGLAIVWAWFHLRRDERSPLFITALIGVLSFVTGVGGFIYRHGDLFQLLFVTLGALLLLSTFVLSRGSAAAAARIRGRASQPRLAFCAALRRRSSACGTSSTRVAIHQELPSGSFTPALRSP